MLQIGMLKKQGHYSKFCCKQIPQMQMQEASDETEGEDKQRNSSRQGKAQGS